MNKNLFIAIIGLAFVGVALYSSQSGNSYGQPPVTSNDMMMPGSLVHNLPTGGGDQAFAKVAPNAVYVGEQIPGRQVVVGMAALVSPGYVVIHEATPEGKPGAIIGNSSLIEEGSGRNIPVTLTRETKDGDLLLAMLHAEMGGDGFSPSTDIPAQDGMGNAVFMIFQVKEGAADPSAEQIMF